MRSTRKLSESGIYHVIQRGTGRQIIFEDDEDRASFLSLLASSLGQSGVELLCWCLMGNHFHLLLRGEMGSVSAAMKLCCSGYAQRFNGRHGRVGHLFQERFKSEPVDDEAYLLTVVRYIHQNPERAGLGRTADWPWSSYREYTSQQDVRRLCETELVTECFGGVDVLIAAHEQICQETDCMEVFGARSQTSAMPDEAAVELAAKVLGEGSIERIKSWDRNKRGAAIAALRNSGLSVRQIERLTGIGRGVINYALKHHEK